MNKAAEMIEHYRAVRKRLWHPAPMPVEPKPVEVDPAPIEHLRQILIEVATKYDITVELMIATHKRKRPLPMIRQEFYYRALTETTKSLPQIGRACGGNTNHSSIIHACRGYCRRNNLPMPRGMKG